MVPHTFTLFVFRRVLALANKLDMFHVFVESDVGIQSLIDTPLNGGKRWSAILEVDCGYGRSKFCNCYVDNLISI